MDVPRGSYWGPKFWDELRSLDPVLVCKRCDVTYDPAGFYAVRSLGRTVRVFPAEERLETEDAFLVGSLDYQLLLVSYLLYAQNIAPEGRWVSEKDLKGGSTFFRGPHALPSAPLERRFGDDPEGFRERATAAGGIPAEFGDVSMTFEILPRVSFVMVLWLKDDEFPARVTFMVDPSIETHLPLDVLFAMTQSVTQKLING